MRVWPSTGGTHIRAARPPRNHTRPPLFCPLRLKCIRRPANVAETTEETAAKKPKVETKPTIPPSLPPNFARPPFMPGMPPMGVLPPGARYASTCYKPACRRVLRHRPTRRRVPVPVYMSQCYATCTCVIGRLDPEEGKGLPLFKCFSVCRGTGAGMPPMRPGMMGGFPRGYVAVLLRWYHATLFLAHP